EVYKHLLRHAGQEPAIRAVAVMQQGHALPLDAELALLSAEMGTEHRLPLADSVIYASAIRHGARGWTQDADFEGLPAVEFRASRWARPLPSACSRPFCSSRLRWPPSRPPMRAPGRSRPQWARPPWPPTTALPAG